MEENKSGLGSNLSVFFLKKKSLCGFLFLCSCLQGFTVLPQRDRFLRDDR